MAKPNARRASRMPGMSARANRNRAETKALGEESRASKYPTDVQFATEDPYPIHPSDDHVRARRGGEGTLARIRALAAQGESPADIAAHLGIEVSQVATWMQRFRITTASKTPDSGKATR